MIHMPPHMQEHTPCIFENDDHVFGCDPYSKSGFIRIAHASNFRIKRVTHDDHFRSATKLVEISSGYICKQVENPFNGSKNGIFRKILICKNYFLYDKNY